MVSDSAEDPATRVDVDDFQSIRFPMKNDSWPRVDLPLRQSLREASTSAHSRG